ncbi:MAG: PAS domain S-box protein [Rhodospirillales bacterium]|nr:PAS domain S-box protein [Rhodospirillales bacterium]
MTESAYAVFLLFLVVLAAAWVGAWWFARRTLDLARQGEERYRGIFSAASVGIVLFDAEGRILEFNQAWPQILGYDAKAIKGFNWHDIPEPDERGGHWALVQRLLAGELQRAETEISFRRENGALCFADLSLSCLLDPSGVARILCVALDITAKRLAEEELKQSRQRIADQLAFQELLLDSMPLPVFVKDSTGRYVALNSAFCAFLGKPGDQIRGRTVYEIAPGELAHIYHQADLDLMRRGGKQVYEAEVETKEEGRRHVVFHKAVFQALDGAVGGIVGVILDITDRITLEQKLAEAKDSAEAAVKVRTEFLAVMSHEIRTPMNGLMGMVQILENSGLPERELNYVRVMRASSEALLALLDDILDVTKLDNERFVFERIDFDLTDLAQSLGQLMSARAEEKGLNFSVELPPGLGWVRGDPGRLRQILLNLIGNAVKFTEKGGVKVKLDVPEENQGRMIVRFQVIDTGVGVPDAALGSIFEPFRQADSSIARRFGGTGLGLAIVKRLVEGMGGQVSASSKAGEGSVFHFMLPFERGRPGTSAEGRAGTYPTDLSILVVDDVEINRMVAEGLLSLDGHRVIHAASGEEALDKLAKASFDVILLDLLMPVMDGYDVAKRVRRLPVSQAAKVPILAMTANVHQADRDRALASGMNGFLPKPLNLKEIRSVLTSVLSGRQGAAPEDGPAGDETALLDEAKLALWFGTFGASKLRDLIGTYRSSSAENFRNLHAALASRDAAQMGRVAHKIAGAAANLGFSALHRQGLNAESAAKKGEEAKALRLGDAMAEIQARSWEALESWLAKAEEGAG